MKEFEKPYNPQQVEQQIYQLIVNSKAPFPALFLVKENPLTK